MKYLIATIVIACTTACGSAPRPVSQDSNAVSTNSNERGQTVIAHSSENQPQPSGTKSKWTQSGKAFDTSQLDSAVTAAEKKAAQEPSDKEAKITLSKAYLERANALTKNGQYASALGDYRRTLKNDPTNAEAKDWIDKIIAIYDSINRESPPEGEEPPPLPYNKTNL